jgi:hypothetical protein
VGVGTKSEEKWLDTTAGWMSGTLDRKSIRAVAQSIAVSIFVAQSGICISLK